MGGHASRNGITVVFHDVKGEVDPNRPQIKGDTCRLTGQGRYPSKEGSEGWIKEIYLAPDPQTLYALLVSFPPQGGPVPLTSAASHNVTLNYVDGNGVLQQEQWKSCIGLGTPVPVKLKDGSSQDILLFDTVLLTNGDPKASTNLKKKWEDAIKSGLLT